MTRPSIHLEGPMARAMALWFRLLEKRFSAPPAEPVGVYIAGGMAMALYTGARMTGDIDAEFTHRVVVPPDLMVEATLDDGQTQSVWFDTSYNPMFALMHEDYQEDAIPVDLGLRHLRAFVLSPVDLAVSKLVRFQPQDREDIAALAVAGLLSAQTLRRRADDAMSYYVGSLDMLRHNVAEAVEIVQAIEAARSSTPSPF